jgi:hypothetical protein
VAAKAEHKIQVVALAELVQMVQQSVDQERRALHIWVEIQRMKVAAVVVVSSAVVVAATTLLAVVAQVTLHFYQAHLQLQEAIVALRRQ